VGGFDETSLTEDWELAARLTEAGYKVVFDQNIRVPAECPSTFRSLVKQQMRWAEGVVRDTRRSLRKMLFSGNPSPLQKFDYVFYGFGSFNGISGSLCWILAFWAFLISERIVQVLGVDRGLILGLGALGKFMLFVAPIYLPLGFVVAVIVGLYKENKLSWAIWCIPGFILSLIITPFIAYSSIRGLIFRRGSWSRTPKTGEITNQ
jgi:cellulose synthase/poly-beta-1,6-N-acetylglucosamine synthase-like glycosyltransferase